MPDSIMSLFPQVLGSLEVWKTSLQAALSINQAQTQAMAAGLDNFKTIQDLTLSLARQNSHFLPPRISAKR